VITDNFKMNRFFVDPALLEKPEIVLDGEVAHQLSRVLRLTPGKRIMLLDNQGSQYEVEISDLRRQGKTETVAVRLIEKRPAEGEPAVHLTLYQGLLKGEKFEYVLQKGTEIGVNRFVPLNTERAIGQAVKGERWRKIVQEAAEQSRRGRVPELAPNALSFAAALQEIKTSGVTGLMAWEEETARTLRVLTPGVKNIALLVGPEGGFSVQEAEQATDAGVLPVTLGKRILRAETAGVVAAALVLYQLGSL
jgi:16S rRNA (uracil1498-N3)-methyltransferase